MKTNWFSFAALFLALTLTRAAATTYFVDVSNSVPLAPYTNWPTAATNIQDAIDVATNGDVILVTNGMYSSGGRVINGSVTNRIATTNAVTIQSVGGPAVTIIQGNPTLGNNAIRCAYLGSGAVLSGFTLTNGGTMTSSDAYLNQSGGGFYANGAVTVSNCIIVSNNAKFYGGGAYQGTLQNCSLIQNQASAGGGIYACAAINCLFTNNSAGSLGSGGAAAFATLTNCKVLSNIASYGGGTHSSIQYGCLFFGNQAAQLGGGIYQAQGIINCTIVGNYARDSGGGVYMNSGPYGVNDSIIYFNTIGLGTATNYYSLGGVTGNCCAIPLITPGPASGFNITNDPAFVNYPGGDFHLSANSPCINTFDATAPVGTDLDGNPRIVDRFVDMGAYEYQSAHLVLPFYFATQYGLTTDGSVDTDGDGMNNWQEAIAGTIPTNPASLLMVTSVSNSVSGCKLTWSSVYPKKYFVQRSTNLLFNFSFVTFRTNVSTLFGITTTTVTDATATNGGPYFYRVGVQ